MVEVNEGVRAPDELQGLLPVHHGRQVDECGDPSRVGFFEARQALFREGRPRLPPQRVCLVYEGQSGPESVFGMTAELQASRAARRPEVALGSHPRLGEDQHTDALTVQRADGLSGDARSRLLRRVGVAHSAQHGRPTRLPTTTKSVQTLHVQEVSGARPNVVVQ